MHGQDYTLYSTIIQLLGWIHKHLEIHFQMIDQTIILQTALHGVQET